MKVINFGKIAVENVSTCKTIKIKLNLNKELDLPLAEFAQYLDTTIKNELENQIKTDMPIIFAFYTDIEQEELEYVRKNIMAALVDYLVGDNKQYRGEKRLGTMGFDSADINLTQFMDLINFVTKVESFDVMFYDSKKRLYKPLLSERKDR